MDDKLSYSFNYFAYSWHLLKTFILNENWLVSFYLYPSKQITEETIHRIFSPPPSPPLLSCSKLIQA